MLLCKDCACEVKIEEWDVYKDKKIPLCFPCLKVRTSFYENIAKNQKAKAKELAKQAKEAEEARQKLIRKKFNEQYMCSKDDSETI